MADPSIWTTLTWVGVTLGVSVVTLGIASIFLPSVAMWMTTIFKTIIDIFRSIGEFFLHRMPRPLQIGLILLLFGLFGGLVYTLTVGATHICIDNNVYKVSFWDGIKFQDWVPRLGNPENGPQKLATLNPDGTTTGIVQFANVNLSRTNIVQVIGPVMYQGLDVGFVTEAAVAVNDPSVNQDLNAFFATPEDQVFSRWLGDDEYISYLICQEQSTKACYLERSKTVELGCNPFGNGGLTVSPIGFLQYWVNVPKHQITPQPNSHTAHALSLDPDSYLVRSCSSSPPPGNTSMWLNSIQVSWYRHQQINILGVRLGADEDIQNVTLYNAVFAPIIRDDLSDKSAVDTADLQMKTISLDAANGLMGVPVLLTGSDKDIVRYQCVDDSLHPYATKMTVMGVNPFEFRTMLAIVALLTIISVWGWFRR